MTGDFRDMVDLRMPVMELEPDDAFIARLGDIAAASGAATPSWVQVHKNWKAALATAGVAVVVTGGVSLAAALTGEQEPVPATPPVSEPADDRDSPAPNTSGDRGAPSPGVSGRDRRRDDEGGDRRRSGSAPQQGSGSGPIGTDDADDEPGAGLPDSGDDGDGDASTGEQSGTDPGVEAPDPDDDGPDDNPDGAEDGAEDDGTDNDPDDDSPDDDADDEPDPSAETDEPAPDDSSPRLDSDSGS